MQQRQRPSPYVLLLLLFFGSWECQAHTLGLLGKPPTAAQLCHALRESNAHIPDSCDEVVLIDGGGRIKSLDPAAGGIEIEHAALQDFAGQGVHRYAADPPVMLRLFQPGDEVTFVIDGESRDVIDLRFKDSAQGRHRAFKAQPPSASSNGANATRNQPADGAGMSGSPYPIRTSTERSPAFVAQPHVTVATACQQPVSSRRIVVKAGRRYALAGEVFGFEPSLIQAQPCEEVELVFVNEDAVRHTFMLPGLNPMVNGAVVGPGETTLRFTTPREPVTLAYHCHVAQHEKHGMRGWLIVGDGGVAARKITKEKTAERFRQGLGSVVSVDRRRNIAVIDHQEISGYMAPMVMAFTVPDAALLATLERGLRVRFTIDTADGRLLAADVVAADSAADGTDPEDEDRNGGDGAQRAEKSIVAGSGKVVSVLTDQDRVVIDHGEIRGFMAPMVMAFEVADSRLLHDLTEGMALHFGVDTVSRRIVWLQPLREASDNQPELSGVAVEVNAGSDPRIAADAVSLGRDLDGDGDPDEIEFQLEIIEIEEEVYPGELLNTWVFAPPGRDMLSAARLPSPTLRVEQGDRVSITLSNTHYFPHTIHLHGTIHPNAMDGVPMVTQHAVMPGESFTYEFVAKNPGTHIYHCHVQPDVHVAMGLIGMLTIEENRPDNLFTHLLVGAGEMPDRSRAVAELYDREYGLVYADADDRLNRIPVSELLAEDIERRMHREYDSTQSQPGIFLLNGRAFPFTLRDSLIRVASGERVKLRMLNAGGRAIYVHTHGHRGIVTHLDGNPLPPASRHLRDVFTIGPAQRVDIELRPGSDDTYSSGPGVWLIHDHSPHAVTNKGINPGGNLTAIAYQGYIGDDGLPTMVGDIRKFFDPAYYRGEIPVFSLQQTDATNAAPERTSDGEAASAVWGVGRIISIDTRTRKILLDHEAIEGLRPAMMVSFRVADGVDMDALLPSSAIRFALDPANNTITAIAH